MLIFMNINQQIPDPLRIVVEQLQRLPGLGPKSAMRIAMTLLKWPESETRRLGHNIFNLRDSLRLCTKCGAFTADNICIICKDHSREQDTLCLISEWDSMIILEESGIFRGQYLILGGLLQAGNSSTDDLEIDKLFNRLTEEDIHEIILALGSTLEAELTGSYITTLVQKNIQRLKLHV